MSSPFLRLPRELRDQIYLHVFTSPHGFVVVHNPGQDSGFQLHSRVGRPYIRIEPYDPYSDRVWKLPMSTSLQRVNKQIHAETRAMLWQCNALYVPNIKDWERLMESDIVESQLRTQSAHIRIDINFYTKGRLPIVQNILETLVMWSHLPGSRLRQLDIRISKNKAWRASRPQHVVDSCAKYVQLLARVCGNEKGAQGNDGKVLGRQVKRKLMVGDVYPMTAEWLAWGLPLNVTKLMEPGGMLRALHEAFRGELWADGILCYRDGVKVG